jgi:hypothetical protein
VANLALGKGACIEAALSVPILFADWALVLGMVFVGVVACLASVGAVARTAMAGPVLGASGVAAVLAEWVRSSVVAVGSVVAAAALVSVSLLLLFAVVLLRLPACCVEKAVGEGIEAAVPVAGASVGRTVVLGAAVECRFENCVWEVSVAVGAGGVVGLAAVG